MAPYKSTIVINPIDINMKFPDVLGCQIRTYTNFISSIFSHLFNFAGIHLSFLSTFSDHIVVFFLDISLIIFHFDLLSFRIVILKR